jgi:DNA-binding transcriptional ArsR family regulator
VADMLWVKMPSNWITSGALKSNFSSNSSMTTDISALKLYMYLCLFSIPITRRKTLSVAKFLPDTPYWRLRDEVTLAEAKLTYDDLTKGCGLSRSLVSRGLRKLVDLKLITKEGTTRKINYVIQGSLDAGWCKLPKRQLVKIEQQVSSFQAIKNRYHHERDALKVFMYLLTIRTNRYQHVDVSRGKISVSTGVDLYHIEESLAFLLGVGLLEEVKSKGYIRNAPDHVGDFQGSCRLMFDFMPPYSLLYRY